MSQPITEHTLATFTIFSTKELAIVLSYIHRTLDIQLYRATIDTINIMYQVQWQLYIQY